MYKLSYDLVGFIFLVFLSGYFFCRPIFPNLSNKYYKWILIISLISAALNIITAHTINYSSKYPIQLNYALNTLVFVFGWTLPYVLYQYVIILTKENKFLTNRFHKALWIYYIIQTLIVLSTSFTHFIIFFDEDLVYHHGTIYLPMALINFALLCLSGALVIIFGKKMPLNQRIIIPTYIIIIIALDFYQFAHPFLLINGLTVSIATFLMFLTLQNPISYFDTLTPNYSRDSFLEYLGILILRNKSFQIIIVDISSTSKINKTFGEKNGSKIIYKTGQKVRWASHHNLTFRLRNDIFLIVTFSLSERDHILNDLESEFPFKHNYSEKLFIDVNVRLNYTNTLKDFKDVDEAYLVILECIKTSKEKNLTRINNGTLNSIKRNRKIEIALKEAISNKDLKIYFQPIIYTKSKKVTNAEALVRIYDKELGLIMPDEFIPMAEKEGNITKITPLIIEGVCKYLSENHLPDTFKTVSINLSVIDCMNPILDKLILNILSKYNISPSLLVFEITETMALIAPSLKNTMVHLKSAGSRFALDDFGSGYANLDAVLKFPFDIIKIDRNLLIMMENKQYKLMVSGIMDTLHSLNLETVVEGIETELQAELVDELNGTYQQGYLYSKPITLDEFTIFINKHDNFLN